MLNRFQLNNEGVWASKTVSSTQCIAWPSPTLFLPLVCQAVNIADSHRQRLQQDQKTMGRHYHTSGKQQHAYSVQNPVRFKTLISFIQLKETSNVRLHGDTTDYHCDSVVSLCQQSDKQQGTTSREEEDMLYCILTEEDLHHILPFSANGSTKS